MQMKVSSKAALLISVAITFVALAPVSPSYAATKYAITCQAGSDGQTFVNKPNATADNYLYWYNSAGEQLSEYFWVGSLPLTINNPPGGPVRVRYQATGFRSVSVACR